MTSTKNARRIAEAVTRRLSIACSATSMAVVAPMLISEPYRSLSIVDATPMTAAPHCCSADAPAWEPLPPMTTNAVMACARRASMASLSPCAVFIASQRIVPRVVPPRSNDAADVARPHRPQIAVDQSFEAVAHAGHFEAARECAAYHGANGCIHAGRIATTGQNCKPLHRDDLPLRRMIIRSSAPASSRLPPRIGRSRRSCPDSGKWNRSPLRPEMPRIRDNCSGLDRICRFWCRTGARVR